jgi:membrane-bound lytic murein transglycosylase B
VKLAAATALALSVFASATARAQTPVDARPSFAEWLADVRTEALSRGIRPDIVDEALTHVDTAPGRHRARPLAGGNRSAARNLHFAAPDAGGD